MSEQEKTGIHLEEHLRKAKDVMERTFVFIWEVREQVNELKEEFDRLTDEEGQAVDQTLLSQFGFIDDIGNVEAEAGRFLQELQSLRVEFYERMEKLLCFDWD